MNPSSSLPAGSDLRWPVSQEVIRPDPATTIVWCAGLRVEAGYPAQTERVLSREEWERAQQFRGKERRDRYLLSRLVLRRILGACLGLEPGRVRIESEAGGKPRVAGETGIEFNLAHSGDLLLVAVTAGIPVGVDVERIRPLNNSQAIARRFFTQGEADWLQRREDTERDRAFFQLWTRKEAVLKATGEGISSGLGTIEGLGADGAFAGTVTRPAAGSGATTWTLRELQPVAGFVGAIAYPAHSSCVELKTVTFPPA